MNEERRESVRAAETTLMVLETIAFSEEELGVTQIAGRLSLSKGAVFRHLQGLMERGFVVQNPQTSRYRLGVRASLIGSMAPPASDLAGAAEPVMREVRDRTAITAVLTTPTATGALVLATVIGFRTIEIGVRKGSELPFHASAQGKVMLAFGPPDLMERSMRLGLPALTPHSITDPDRLRANVEEIRQAGHSTAPQEALLGINTIAAPVFDCHDALVGAVALCGSIQHVTSDPTLVTEVINMGIRVSRSLGHGINVSQAG